MSSDDGEDFVKNPVGAIANVWTQTVTGGLAGIDPATGKFKKGFELRALDEGLGEITGRNLARDQAAAADSRVKAEDAKRTQELLAQQAQDAQNDMQASLATQGVRNTARAKAQENNDFSPAKDFLGL